MQRELDASHPLLDIEIVGINDWALGMGNEDISLGRDIAWLQDVDSDQNGTSDIWERWDVTFRDVAILDSNNRKVADYNLTVHDLSDPQNYETLRQMFIQAAVPEPSTNALLASGAIVFLFGIRHRPQPAQRGRCKNNVT